MISWIKGHSGWLLVLGSLAFVCLFFLNSWIDSRITIDHMSQEMRYRQKERELLQSLLLETGKRIGRSELTQLVKDRFGKDHLIKEEEQNQLSVDAVVLVFRENSLVNVKSYGK